MSREFRGPTTNPLATATMIDLLHGYAEGAAATTPLQQAVERALSNRDYDRKIAKTLVQNFTSIPAKIKTPVFGEFAGGRLRALSDDELSQVFARPRPGVVFQDDVSLGDPAEYPPGTLFTVLYTGLYCKDRTGDRNVFGPSDEPYVITVSVDIVGGQNVERSELHPVGDPDQHYGDVDDGEFRRGPIAAVWAGPEPAEELSIVTVVMEHDEGDPKAYEEEVGTIVSLAAAVAAYFNIAIGAAIKAFAEDVILWVIDSGDDMIGTEVVTITPEWIRRYPHQYPVRQFSDTRTVLKPVGLFQYVEEEVVDNTDLDFQFISRHTDRGEYAVTYKVTADNDPVRQPPGLSGIKLDQEVFVVSNL